MLLKSLNCNYCILSACFDIAIHSQTRAHVLLELAAASIQERRLLCSAHPKVRRQFESAV